MLLYFGGHTYEVNQSAWNWVDSATYAENAGGHLAIIQSKAENDAIFKFLQKDAKAWDSHYVAGDGGNAEYVWLGGNDYSKEGKWEWSDGTKLTYTNWGYGGEPDNYKNQDAMAIGLDSWPQPEGGLGKAGQWNDIDVTNGLYSLIEFDGLYGTNGADKITGSNLDEVFYSGAGSDTLNGLGGKDKIEGGAGKDSLFGGAGADTFIYASKADSTLKLFDTIHDFSVKEHDKIDLGDVAKASLDFIGSADFSGDGAEVRFGTKSGQTTISVDVDGNGKADMSIVLDGTINLHATDFLL